MNARDLSQNLKRTCAGQQRATASTILFVGKNKFILRDNIRVCTIELIWAGSFFAGAFLRWIRHLSEINASSVYSSSVFARASMMFSASTKIFYDASKRWDGILWRDSMHSFFFFYIILMILCIKIKYIYLK